MARSRLSCQWQGRSHKHQKEQPQEQRVPAQAITIFVPAGQRRVAYDGFRLVGLAVGSGTRGRPTLTPELCTWVGRYVY